MPTYIAFAADGNEDMFESDIKYYRLIQAWDAMKGRDFEFINAHERSSALRSGSKEDTIKRTLRERLNKSKRMLLLVGKTTKLDDDFVPYEIEYAVDTCKIPVIICYVNQKTRMTGDGNPSTNYLRSFLPVTLKHRIDKSTVRTINIPFRQRIIAKAIADFNKTNLPVYSFGFYMSGVYDRIYKPGEI
jgi:hypothetical protein